MLMIPDYSKTMFAGSVIIFWY